MLILLGPLGVSAAPVSGLVPLVGLVGLVSFPSCLITLLSSPFCLGIAPVDFPGGLVTGLVSSVGLTPVAPSLSPAVSPCYLFSAAILFLSAFCLSLYAASLTPLEASSIGAQISAKSQLTYTFCNSQFYSLKMFPLQYPQKIHSQRKMYD